jgi:hypothetical protein
MASAVTSAIDAIESETDPDEIMPELATTLDGLWRELTGVYATVLNMRFAENTEGIDPEEILDQIREGLRQQAEMNDMDEHEIRQEMLSNEHIRAGLRHLGINPDAL